eukprot:g25549.t1
MGFRQHLGKLARRKEDLAFVDTQIQAIQRELEAAPDDAEAKGLELARQYAIKGQHSKRIAELSDQKGFQYSYQEEQFEDFILMREGVPTLLDHFFPKLTFPLVWCPADQAPVQRTRKKITKKQATVAPIPPVAPTPPNAFTDLAFDPVRKGPDVVLAGRTLRGTGNANSQLVLGTKSITCTPNSGYKGYFEVKIISSAGDGHVSIGLALDSVALTTWLGGSAGGFRWRQTRYMNNQLVGFVPPSQLPPYNVGDSIGLMVDCSAAPQLKFFVNRVCVLTCPFPSGIVVYPAFCVFTGELLLAEGSQIPAS